MGLTRRWVVARHSFLGVTLLTALTAAADLLWAQSSQPPVFRGRVALVTIDVRVVDPQGHPVPDLNADDFTVLEDGVPQSISHFAIQGYVGSEPRPPDHDSVPIADRGTAHVRTFLFVLGRGRLQGPSRGFDGLLDFIDTRTLPGDRLGVVAYDRVSEITTDHAAIRRLIQRYRAHHERIEAMLDHWFRGLTAFYGDGEVPRGAQARIDALFDSPDIPRVRILADAPLPGDGFFEVDREKVLASLGATDSGRRGEFTSVVATRQDMEKLHAAVEFLRHVDGEKHLVLITYEGLLQAIPSAIDRLARMAADARVTLSAIQTGGMDSSWVTGGRGSRGVLLGPSWQHRWANEDLRSLAERTGGLASIYRYADRGLEEIDRASRLQYVLGYYPSNAAADGDFRRITVRVNRPNVQVLHRSGYYARPEPWTYDRRALVTNSRLIAGANYRGLIGDIPVTVGAELVEGPRDNGKVSIQVKIAGSAIMFVETDGHWRAELDLALYVGDSNQRQIGELRRRVEFNLTPESYARARADGVAFNATLPFEGRARHAKVVVYQYDSDRLGTAVVEVGR